MQSRLSISSTARLHRRAGRGNLSQVICRLLTIALVTFAGGGSAFAWDYEGHRTVNLLAIDSLPPGFPAFIKESASRERIGFLAGEADRWRNTPDLPLKHANGPDHFIDIEDLIDPKKFNIPVQFWSPFRYAFVEQLVEARMRFPDRLPAIPKAQNWDRTKQFTGFLPWTIMEYYSKVKSGFSYLKAFEELGTAEEIRQARENLLYVMGVMGHFAGDASQPLHTTKHYNGWVGDNPRNYTTNRTFHSWIDGGFLSKTGGIDAAKLRGRLRPALARKTIDGRTDFIFPVITGFIMEQHPLVEPLYRLEQSGRLNAEAKETREGQQFLEGQIVKAAQFLGDLWLTAWKNASEDKYLIGKLNERKLDATRSPDGGKRGVRK